MPPDDGLELFPTPSSEATGPRPDPNAPLADRMRPRALGEIVGQDHLLGERSALGSLLRAGELPSLILWGPPGCGKTTLARVLASRPLTRFEPLSAVSAGIKEIRAAVERARNSWKKSNRAAR